MFFSCDFCVWFMYRSMRSACHSFRGATPDVCVCLIMCDLENSKRDELGQIWAVVSQKAFYNATSYSKEQGNVPRLIGPQGFERGIIQNLTSYFTV